MLFSVIDRGYPCHFPEGWRDNDLNPKELKPFASGAFRQDLRQKIVVSGKATPWSFSKLNVINELIGWFLLSWYWRVWEKHDITENFPYITYKKSFTNFCRRSLETSLKTSRRWSAWCASESSITKGLVVWKKWNRFVFGRGVIWGLWLKGRPGDLCVCVCVFVFSCLMLLCYVVLCYAFFRLYLLHLVRFIIIIMMIIIPILVPPGSLV